MRRAEGGSKQEEVVKKWRKRRNKTRRTRRIKSRNKNQYVQRFCLFLFLSQSSPRLQSMAIARYEANERAKLDRPNQSPSLLRPNYHVGDTGRPGQ